MQPKTYPYSGTKVITTSPDKFNTFFVGAERILEQLRDAANIAPGVLTSTTNFPPYNIIKVSEFEYLLEIAVAGYKVENLDVETAEGILTIQTQDDLQDEDDTADASNIYPRFLHRGIARRSFKRQFILVDTMEVKDVQLDGGLLKIRVFNHLPEYKHPKKFNIAVKPAKPKKQVTQ